MYLFPWYLFHTEIYIGNITGVILPFSPNVCFFTGKMSICLPRPPHRKVGENEIIAIFYSLDTDMLIKVIIFWIKNLCKLKQTIPFGIKKFNSEILEMQKSLKYHADLNFKLDFICCSSHKLLKQNVDNKYMHVQYVISTLALQYIFVTCFFTIFFNWIADFFLLTKVQIMVSSSYSRR